MRIEMFALLESGHQYKVAAFPPFSLAISKASKFTHNPFASSREATDTMPPPQTPTRRRDLEIAKRQFTFLVSITATVFILCPECLRIYRNLCIVPALAWLTGFAFDLINSLSNTWDNAPAVLKYFIPVDMNVPITAPFDQISTYVGPTLSWATSRARLMALEAKARIMALRQVVLLVLANWFLHQLGLG